MKPLSGKNSLTCLLRFSYYPRRRQQGLWSDCTIEGSLQKGSKSIIWRLRGVENSRANSCSCGARGDAGTEQHGQAKSPKNAWEEWKGWEVLGEGHWLFLPVIQSYSMNIPRSATEMKKLLNRPFLQVICPSANPVLRTNICSSQETILLSCYEVSTLLSLSYLNRVLEDPIP